MATSEVTLARGGVTQFVGRAGEIAWLRQLLSEAADGEMRVALVKGEPGVGKTRLLREFLSIADGLGWQTVSGHCSLDTASVHLPFATGLAPQMVRAGILAADGSDAPRGDDLPMLAADLAGKTVELAARRQLVFSIDDYQFGEPSTLRLIGEYVRNLCEASRREPLRLLLIITHHPALAGDAFAPALDQLRREPQVHAMELAGLEEVEVHELIREASATPCDPRLLGAVVEATNGNPLFVMEVLRDLDRRHLLSRENGHLATPKVNELHLPATASSALSQRLEAAGPEVLALVQAGSLLGDSFGLEEAGELASSGDLEGAADRAIGLGLLQDEGGRLAFCHGMVRTAVAESIPPLRRRRMHGEIAERLLGRFGEGQEHAIEIANHVASAGKWADATQAGEIYVRAGDAALASFLWGTAQRFFEAALAVEGYVEGLDGRARGWLYARAARANNNNGDRGRSRELHRKAMEEFREADDLAGWGLQLLGWWRTFTNAYEPLPDDGSFEEFSTAAGDEAIEVQAQLLMHQAESLRLRRDLRDENTGRSALEMARRTDDVETRAYAAVVMGLIENRHLRPEAAAEHFRHAGQVAESIASPRVRNWGPSRLAMPLILLGDLAGARAACEFSTALAVAGHDIANGPLTTSLFHQTAILTGEFELARSLRVEGSMSQRRSLDRATAHILCSGAAWERMLRGEYDESEDAIVTWAEFGGRSVARSTRLLIQTRKGEAAEARQEVAQQALVFGASGVDYDNVGSIAAAAELAAELGLADVSERAVDLLKPVVEARVVFSVNPPILIPRAAAAAARACGRLEQARTLIETAERVSASAGSEPERGLTALERARFLVATRAPQSQVDSAFQTAGDVFARYDMVGALTWLREFVEASGFRSRLPRLLDAESELSGTEAAIVQSLAAGIERSRIADELLLTARTVDAHLSRLARRVEVTDSRTARTFLQQSKSGASSPGTRARRPELDELTPRELEVLQLIARGLTNQQIADELVISPHTAIRHVANILSKTGAANRTEAAALAG